MLRGCTRAWPLPWIATEAGWLVNEAGRQPWAVTGMLTTRASLGGVTTPEVMAYLGVAAPAAALLLALCVAGIVAHVRRGPVRATRETRAPRGDAPAPT
jgi:cytochrome d ubiquinol oxidase subunit I